MKYYHLIAGLPDIKIEDNKLTYSIADFRKEVRPILSRFDAKVMDLFFMKFDNQNLLNFLKDKEAKFDERGNITKSEMEECFRLISLGRKPKNKYFLLYLKTFMLEYLNPQQEEDKKKDTLQDDEETLQEEVDTLPEKEEEEAVQQEEEDLDDDADVWPPKKKEPQVVVEIPQLDDSDTAKWENRLAEIYYRWAMEYKNKFVSAWFEFNLNLNNILSAYASRKYKMNVEVLGDNAVAVLVKTSKQRDFELGEIIEDIDLFQRISDEPDLFDREKKIDLMRWKWLDEQTYVNYFFSIEKVFTYLVKLEIIERWITLDPVEGRKLFRTLIDSLKKSVVDSPELKILQM